MTFAAIDHPAALRGAGLRVTGPRVAVLGALTDRPHSSVETIVDAVRRSGTVSTQAVYDVLRVLHEAKLVRRVEPAGSPARYEVDSGDDHHHFVCRGCGEIRDLDHPRVPDLAPEPQPGFVIDEVEVTFWGRCADCQSDTPHGQPEALGAGT